LEDARDDYATNVSAGDYVVAGDNFGMGSSREQAPVIIKLSGARAVLAKSFARIFFRNAINVGLAAIEVDTTGIEEGDKLSVDFTAGKLVDHTNGVERSFEPLPPIMTEILADGGLIAHIKKHGDFNL
jgi:3-isopropylmalate/(R)-2-methylmalate dehydratase small subunit